VSTLATEHPVEYPKGTTPLSDEDVRKLAGEVPGWEPRDGKLHRSYEFADFNESFGFVSRVALLAEAEGHHPDIFVSWNRVDLTFWTHTAEGLTRNDFIMAAKISAL
jgi:4a-hydroxytetrahydrobiopterin dehydratase